MEACPYLACLVPLRECSIKRIVALKVNRACQEVQDTGHNNIQMEGSAGLIEPMLESPELQMEDGFGEKIHPSCAFEIAYHLIHLLYGQHYEHGKALRSSLLDISTSALFLVLVTSWPLLTWSRPHHLIVGRQEEAHRWANLPSTYPDLALALKTSNMSPGSSFSATP
jgi:hypothetical protein